MSTHIWDADASNFYAGASAVDPQSLWVVGGWTAAQLTHVDIDTFGRRRDHRV